MIGAGDGGNAGLCSDVRQFLPTPLPAQGGGVTYIWRLDNGEVCATGNQFLLRG